MTYNLNYVAYLNTVENIRNLGVNEIIGHKIDGYNAAVGMHRFGYLLQMNDATFFKTM